MKAPVVLFEVIGKDGQKLRSFYGDVFGWKYELDKEMDYGMVGCSDEGIPGGVGTAPKGSGWTTFYIQVPDLEQAVKAAEQAGGQILQPITKLPNVTLAVVSDPEGHPVGLVLG